MKAIRILTVIAAMGAATVSARADSIIAYADNETPALTIQNGTTGTLSVIVASGGTSLKAVINGTTNTLAAGASGTNDTVAAIAASFAALTNALTVDSSYSLPTDGVLTQLLNGTYSAVSGAKATLLWNTKNAGAFSVGIPKGYAYTATRIAGLPGGTGNVTLKAWLGNDLVLWKSYPVSYVLGEGGTNVLDSTINIDEEMNIPVGASQSFIVKAFRATSPTGGLLSVITK